MTEIHKCVTFQRLRREAPWRSMGSLRERDIEAISVCRDCGRERPGRFRKIIEVQRESSQPQIAIVDASLRLLARRIASRSRNHTELRADRLVRRLGGVQAESDIERLASAARLRLVYRSSAGTLQLHSIRVLDRSELEELARPGLLARRASVLEAARNAVQQLVNPEAVSIREILTAHEAMNFDDRVIKTLAALAGLVEAGEAVPAKAFSARVLGDSKSLARLRSRVERLVGPLERLGIRDWGGLVLLSGAGVLHLEKTEISLQSLRCIGISSDDVLTLSRIEPPEGGLVVIENLTPFQACLEQLNDNSSVLLVWSGGFPNRGVKRLLEQAAKQKVRIRVWCDLDLGGVRIARMIHQITSGVAEPVLMSPAVLHEARHSCPLTPFSAASIHRDLEQHPDAILADTLHALLSRNAWVEQETLLGKTELLLRNDPLLFPPANSGFDIGHLRT